MLDITYTSTSFKILKIRNIKYFMLYNIVFLISLSKRKNFEIKNMNLKNLNLWPTTLYSLLFTKWKYWNFNFIKYHLFMLLHIYLMTFIARREVMSGLVIKDVHKLRWWNKLALESLTVFSRPKQHCQDYPQPRQKLQDQEK